MTVLAIQLPPRERLAARAAGTESAVGLWLPAEWSYSFSADGRSVAQSGAAAAALLPRADRTVLVLADADVSWHRVVVPKAPPARLRAALLGLMEESLLDDDDSLHFALAPGAVPGQTGFVAVTHRPRLQAALAALEAAGRGVDRVVPATLPTGIGADPALDLAALPLRGHFQHRAVGTDRHDPAQPGESSPWLSLARGDGVSVLRLSGALARALVFGSPPSADPPAGRWTATPAAAAAAEAWLSAPVELLTDAERTLEAAASDANLRQFDLAPRHRGTRALREVGKQFGSAQWRPVRIGLAVLLLVQVVGLNLHAWQLRRAVDERKLAMTTLLQATHPNVRAVLDAPLQMQRETERLRAAAGRPGGADLESLLGAAAAAWPDGTGPVQTLRFESGALTLAAAGWTEPQVAQFRDRLRGSGFAVESAEGRLTVTRAGTTAPNARGAA